MKRTELLEKCKSLGIKKVSSKSKSELIAILESTNKQITDNQTTDKYKIAFNNVLTQLLQILPKDKTRTVCEKCYELGHESKNENCKFYDKNNIYIKYKIQNYILSQHVLNDKIIENSIFELSQILGISNSFCNTLYQEVINSEFTNRNIDIQIYIQNIKDNSQKCYDCNKQLYFVQKNTNRIWKNNHLCDLCWAKYKPQRDILWQQIITYKPKICTLCSYQQIIQDSSDERFHYDHINMFNKDLSICDMVNSGTDIQIIYKELDKCQILCITCHHIVTDIENKLGFTTIKRNLTRNLNKQSITQSEYNIQTLHYKNLYQIKMLNVYQEIKNYIIYHNTSHKIDTT